MLGYSSKIRKSSAPSFIMFVSSSNPSCSKQLRPFVYDKKSDRLLVYNTKRDRDSFIIRMIYKCIKKDSFVFYLFHYIHSYSMPMI